MKIRALQTLLLLSFSAILSWSQPLNPIIWSVTVEPQSVAPGGKLLARVKAEIEPGWHLYSLSTPDGPIPTTIKLVTENVATGTRIFQPKPQVKFDPNFNADTELYDGVAVFLMEITLRGDVPAGTVELEFQARNQACDESRCLPPRRHPMKGRITVVAGGGSATAPVPEGYTEFTGRASGAAAASSTASATDAAAPAPLAAQGEESLWRFLALAFGFGLAAIFTPCVFPMIPITMSYFLNRPAGSRGQAVFHAALFCLGIVFLFTALGLLATAALGPFGIVQLGSNVWVNLFIALVFLAFGLSLLGAFEITIPSSVLTRLDRVSQGGGVLGTLIMGLTFSLTAFACVGPFVGTLLAASLQGGGLTPALGMVSFSSGLASPFFLLALFPSYLKKMPKSGGWLARVKTVMGFVILAAMLKYVSNIDVVMQWNILTRERFLSAWIILFALPGLYLLGFLRLPGIAQNEELGLPRLLTGSVFLIFSISLIPGLFGANLGELDAFVPYASQTSGLSPAGSPGGRLEWKTNAYQEAIQEAKQTGKHVFVSFTGYACTNCHWMKANMFSKPEIAESLSRFVLVELYTDGTDEVSEANQKFQETRFNTIAIPFYAIVDGDERVITTFAGLTRNTADFLKFLDSGTSSPASQK